MPGLLRGLARTAAVAGTATISLFSDDRGILVRVPVAVADPGGDGLVHYGVLVGTAQAMRIQRYLRLVHHVKA